MELTSTCAPGLWPQHSSWFFPYQRLPLVQVHGLEGGPVGTLPRGVQEGHLQPGNGRPAGGPGKERVPPLCQQVWHGIGPAGSAVLGRDYWKRRMEYLMLTTWGQLRGTMAGPLSPHRSQAHVRHPIIISDSLPPTFSFTFRDVLGPGPSPKARNPEAIFPGPIRPKKKSSGFRAWNL